MRKALATLVLLLMVMVPMAGSQEFQIADVVVEGTQRVEKSAILSRLSAKPGQTVSAELVDQDVKAIYQMGRFEDVEAVLEQSNGANILIYRVKERPLVRHVVFTGNDELKNDKLLPLLTFKTPTLYQQQQIDSSVKAIREAYVKEGFYAVQVTPELQVNDRSEGTVTFRIDEGDKALVDTIRFSGNHVFTDRQLKKFIETKERWFLSWLTGRGTYLEEVIQNDLELIADQYYNQGYLQIRVKQPEVTLSEDKRDIDIYIEIEEGPQFRVGKVDIQGDLIRDKDELMGLVKLKPGDIFSRKELRQDVFKLNDLYADDGYAYVNVSPLTKLDVQQLLVDLTFDIEKGVRVRINRVNIAGNTKTRDKVIRREVQLTEGDLFSSTKLKESRRQVNNLGFFETVDVSTSKTEDEALMDIDVDVKERPTGNFSVGAGYSSVDGVIGQGSISQDNFLGRSLKLNLSAALGGTSTTYNIGLVDPYFLDRKLTLGFDLYKTDREYLNFDKKTTGGDVKLGFPAGKDNRVFFLYRYEQKDIFNVDSGATFAIRSQEGESTLSSLSGSFTRDTTDYRLDPTKGYMSSATLEFAGLGGTEKFASVSLDHRHFIPFWGSTYFSLHGRISQIFDVGGEDIPIDEKYFLGGINTLRGFESRKVGPRVENVTSVVDPVTGEVISVSSDFEYLGGDKEAFANLEYIFPLVPDLNLKGLVFFDAGNAWGEDEDFFDEVRYSAGFGVRWFSPMGPMRLEWGFNLDPRDDEEKSQFEFSLGRFF